MSRGESQKPVTDSYRSNWEAIFQKPKEQMEPGYRKLTKACWICGAPRSCVCKADCAARKRPEPKSEPCGECRGTGRRWFADPQHVMSMRCEYCGGLGFLEPF